MEQISKYKREEKLNTLSHLMGASLGIVGLFLLLEKNENKSEYSIVSILIYSAALISMFAISAGYHSTSNFNLKKKLRVLDHINIYFLIAGTYTPIALITLIHGNGWTIFYTVWILAALGALFKVFYTRKLEFLSLVLYVAMGWLILLDFDNLVDYTPVLGLRLLFLGGAFYTFGILFYALERIPHNHFIWHIFVLGGSICHWSMIFLTVV